MTRPHTPRPLPTLPTEVLNLITSQLDCNSLVTLKRVSRAFLNIDDTALWEHLHLTLPQFFGSSPAIQPHPFLGDTGGDEYLRWAGAEADSCSLRHQAGLREKVKAVIAAGVRGRWPAVKQLTMAPRPYSVGPMMLVLDFESPHLETLHIDVTRYHHFLFLREYPFILAIDTIGCPLTLPSLTHLHLTSISSQSCAFILFLIDSAPNLIALEVVFDRRISESYNKFAWPGFFSARNLTTKIRQLRFSWGKRAGKEDFPAIELFAEVLMSSPEVCQVVLAFDDSKFRQRTWNQLLRSVYAHPGLRDLLWPISDFGREPSPSNLRRLVIGASGWSNIFDDLPDMQALEELYLQGAPSLLPIVGDEPPRFTELTINSTNFPDFSAELRTRPCLKLIHALPADMDDSDIDFFTFLDTTESLRGLPGRVASMSHAGSPELVSLSFPRHYVLINQPGDGYDPAQYPSPDYESISYQVRNTYPWRDVIFKRISEAVWQTFTDYRGKTVPDEVTQALREEEGGEADKWDKRGVQVGAKAWAILESWYEGA